MTPQELKNSILQMAIQGRLVEQRPEEGTAEELYQQIQAEKQKLIKEKKIKKDKPLPEITDDEKPFDIPESWKWVRLNSIAYQIGDIDHKMPPTVERDGVPYISPLNFTANGKIDYDGAKQVSKDNYRKLSQKCTPSRNDIVFPRYGTIGVVRLIDTDRKFLVSYSCCTIKNLDGHMCPKYVFYALQSNMIKGEINRYVNKTTQPNIGLQSIKNFLFPLPPLAEQKRIVAKIEELLPLIDRYEMAWTKLEAFNKRFPEDMQKSILQEAIRGKLVEQRPEEGTGEELYQQIQAEKQRLIAEKKIKKEKPLPEITEDEKPFDIPDSWKWVRLQNISTMCLGKMLDRQKNVGTAAPYLRNVNVRWGLFDMSDLLEMKFEDISDERFLIRMGDIVMCEGGEPGRCAVWEESQSIHFQKALHRIRPLMIQPYFIFYIFKLYSNSGWLNSFFTGTTIKHLTGESLKKVIIPLPPLAEQKRIVAKIEQLLPLCERLKY